MRCSRGVSDIGVRIPRINFWITKKNFWITKKNFWKNFAIKAKKTKFAFLFVNFVNIREKYKKVR